MEKKESECTLDSKTGHVCRHFYKKILEIRIFPQETSKYSKKVIKLDQETWMVPDPFVIGYMTVSKLCSLLLLKSGKYSI